MGAIIDIIYSSPIPTIVAIVIAILLGAGYWFFVFPLLDEVKLLRTRNVELENSLLDTSKKNADALATLTQTLLDIKTVVERPTANGSSYDDLRLLCEGISNSISDMRVNLGRENPRERAELMNQMDSMDRNIERILRGTSEISEKQSQVTGIILGITMQRGTPPRSV